jgi:hypothetical protein
MALPSASEFRACMFGAPAKRGRSMELLCPPTARRCPYPRRPRHIPLEGLLERTLHELRPMRKRSVLLLAREERPGALLCARDSSAVTWKCSIRRISRRASSENGSSLSGFAIGARVPQSQQFRKSIAPARLLDRRLVAECAPHFRLGRQKSRSRLGATNSSGGDNVGYPILSRW